jgi:hypothetical protein
MIVHPVSRVSHGVLTSIFPVFSGIDSAIWVVTRQSHGDGSKTNCNYIGGGRRRYTYLRVIDKDDVAPLK